jgi:hypothetical protein
MSLMSFLITVSECVNKEGNRRGRVPDLHIQGTNSTIVTEGFIAFVCL